MPVPPISTRDVGDVVSDVSCSVFEDFLLVEHVEVLVVSIDEVHFDVPLVKKELHAVQVWFVVAPDSEVTDVKNGVQFQFVAEADDLFGLSERAVPVTRHHEGTLRLPEHSG